MPEPAEKPSLHSLPPLYIFLLTLAQCTKGGRKGVWLHETILECFATSCSTELPTATALPEPPHCLGNTVCPKCAYSTYVRTYKVTTEQVEHHYATASASTRVLHKQNKRNTPDCVPLCVIHADRTHTKH